jgi:hypothetical protein
MHSQLIIFVHNRLCCLKSAALHFRLQEPQDLRAADEASDALCWSMARSLRTAFFRKVAGAGPTPTPMIDMTGEENTSVRCVVQLVGLPDTTSDPAKSIWMQDYTRRPARSLVTTPGMTCWTIFALQMLWEAQCILHERPEKAHANLRMTGRDMAQRCHELDSNSSLALSECIKLVAGEDF